jgi:hypothetical protein
MKFYDFLTTPELCGDEFTGESWAAHREVIARLWDGDTHLIAPEYHALACELLGCETLPEPGEPAEMYLGFGRRSGKTRLEAAAAVHAWAEPDYRDRGLATGEWATISIHAVDKRQAGIAFGYCEGLIRASQVLSAELLKDPTSSVIESKHQTRIEIFSSNFRAARGFSMPLAIIDEAAFLRDEFSATPDMELRRAILPALATLRGRLLVASSLHRRAGLMYEMHRKHFGKAA